MVGIYNMTILEKRERVENLWKWVIALKSGKYKHIKDALRTDEGFDCFGVACEIFKEEGDTWADYGETEWAFEPGSGPSAFYGLPVHIMKKIGFTHKDEQFIMEINDKSDDFDEVAKSIIHYYVKPIEMSIGVFNMQREMI